MTPAVSIVMPVHNEATWLGSAIESVRRQELSDWELLIVDDGSADGSRAVIESQLAQEPLRIRGLSHPGRARLGAAASRNLAISVARGRYLAFLDADDLYGPEKLAAEVKTLDANPGAAMLYGPALWRWQDGRKPDRLDRIGVECGRMHEPPELVWRILLDSQGDVPCTCAVLIRTDTARAVGGFDTAFTLYEDQTLWAKIFLRHRVYVSSAAHSVYRQHDSSTSAEAVRQGMYDRSAPHPARQAFLEWVGEEIKRAGVDRPDLRRALWRAQLPYRSPVLGRIHYECRRSLHRAHRAFGRYAFPQDR
jgi:glycosyltransferase involved in cell wall biosynthesis